MTLLKVKLTHDNQNRNQLFEWRKAWAVLTASVIACGTLVAVLLTDIPREVGAVFILLLMLLLLMLNIPVAVAMGLTGLLGLWAVGGQGVVVGVMGEVPFQNTASFTLTVLPMFIFMGLMLWRSNITTDLYAAAKHWIGWVPGGLGVTTNVAGAGLGAVSGSTIGITYAVGRIGIPEMIKSGYSTKLALGSVISAGTIGQLIPPSILLVVYAGFAEVPVGPQLLAGILPAVVLTLAYALVIVVWSSIWRSAAPNSERGRSSLRAKMRATIAIWPLPIMATIIIGGMSSGLFTPTEAGAVGAAVAVLYTFFRLGNRAFWRAAQQALSDTLVAVGSIMFLLMGAAILNRFLALSGATRWFAETIDGLGLTAFTFILLLILFYLILGMFMDPTAMILLTVPLFLPTAIELGISPLWFGVFLVLMGEIAIMTPPVGILTFIVHRIAQNNDVNIGRKVSLAETYKAALIFVVPAIITAVILALFPDLATWLPEVSSADSSAP